MLRSFQAIISWDCVISYIFDLEHNSMVTMQPQHQRWSVRPDRLLSAVMLSLPINNAAPLINARSLTRTLSVHVGLSPHCNYPFFLVGRMRFAEHGGHLTSLTSLERAPGNGWSGRRRNPTNACRHQEEHWWWISTHEALHAVWKHLCSSAKGHEADCDSAEMNPDHKCDSHLSGIEAALLQFTSTTWKLEIIKPSDRKFSLISCLLF